MTPMPDHYGAGHAPVTYKLLKLLVPRSCPGALPRSAPVACNLLRLFMPRFAPLLPPIPPLRMRTRVRAVHMRNDMGSARVSNRPGRESPKSAGSGP